MIIVIVVITSSTIIMISMMIIMVIIITSPSSSGVFWPRFGTAQRRRTRMGRPIVTIIITISSIITQYIKIVQFLTISQEINLARIQTISQNFK